MVDAEKLRRAVLDTALDAIISIDRNGCVVEWNPAAETTFGYTREQAMGRMMSELIVPPAERAAHTAGIARYVATGESRVTGRRIEMNGMRADSSEFPIELAITADELGDDILFTAHVRDISERRASEQELAQARDAALEAARLKSQFLATISHELRTPLNGILGMIAVLLGSDLDEAQRSYARAIQASGDALHSIIDDLLDFTEVDQGKVVLSATEFNLPDLVRATAEGYAERLGNRGIALRCEIDSGVPRVVRGDGGRVIQVLGCLLDNSVKFTTEGEVVVRVYSCGVTKGRVETRIEVADTGSGISKEQLANLFQPFVQGDGSATRRHGGTGLGLSICYGILELMGGTIRIDSVLGRGTNVSCAVPLEVDGHVADEHPSDAPCENVLIVDGNVESLAIITDYFASWGVDPVVATGGDAALRELQALRTIGEAADVVLIASELPNESGVDVARKIATCSPNTPVLMIKSGHADFDDRSISGCVTRPVKRSELYHAVSDVVTTDTVETTGVDDGPAPGPLTCLVVEDNIINQQVLTAMLESMGHVVHMAENGVEAVDAFKPEFFDLIFMDIQMPEMDGYEATQRIRQLENGRTHVPIIAVTANAMKGDREACLAAGMDDYVPKPVDPIRLATAIKRAGARFSTPRADRIEEPTPASSDAATASSEKGSTTMGATLDLSVLDKLRAYQREGQPDIVTRLIDLFLGQAPNHVEAVQVALQEGDADKLSRAAHALKGASANLGATKLTELAAAIETQGRNNDIATAAQTVAALVAEYALVETDLSAQRLPLPSQTQA